MTHFWDLNEYYLWFALLEKKEIPIFFLQYNENFGVRVIQHHHRLKIFHRCFTQPGHKPPVQVLVTSVALLLTV